MMEKFLLIPMKKICWKKFRWKKVLMKKIKYKIFPGFSFSEVEFFYFEGLGWKLRGSILGNIRKSFFWENIRKTSLWENIRIFFILELESSISENTIISSKIRVPETIHTQTRGFRKFLLYCKQAKLSNILTASNKGIYRKLVRTLFPSRNFYIKRNNNKTDSIETGRIVIACFLP